MFFFNPEHDLCLANGDINFMPPASALKFGHDCASLLEDVYADSANICHNQNIMVWGWNPSIRNRLKKAGIAESHLPSFTDLNNIKKLQHRRTALEGLKFIRSSVQQCNYLVCNSPIELFSAKDAEEFIRNNPGTTMLKAPLSGSGKGLRWTNSSSISHSDIGWCRQTIAKQGSVMAEIKEEVVQDFAMLFHIDTDGNIDFLGYSLFNTNNGAYTSNVLASDDFILKTLSRYIPANVIRGVRNSVTKFLQTNIKGDYTGFIGADMFICKGSAGTPFLLHPCVEFNFRHTMGIIARHLFNYRYNHLTGTDADGSLQLKVVFSRSLQEFQKLTANAVWCCSKPSDTPDPHGHYAIIIQ